LRIDPNRIVVDFYFGDLQYWKLPKIAADALEHGYEGPALRSLATLADRMGSDIREDDIRAEEIHSAFREMGVDAPITKDEARLTLAIESAKRVLNGESDVFDQATYIRIHLCELSDPPDALKQIVNLSRKAKDAPRSQWSGIESDLQNAFAAFLDCQKLQTPE
jgi:hypothetical protein